MNDDDAGRERTHEGAEEEALPKVRFRPNLELFLATVVSVFFAGTMWSESIPPDVPLVSVERFSRLHHGWHFAVPLLAILLSHEFGHYFAARWHRVPASLPYFIPLPLLSPLGTMGAVIAMRGRIRSRDALLDIGASGPLAGLVVTVIVLWQGLSLSEVRPVTDAGVLEGQSLLYALLKRLVVGPIPEGHDVFLHPTAFAGWAGLLVTSINLIPVGQLDGGHIAYALFGPLQNKVARRLHAALLLLYLYNVIKFLGPIAASGAWDGERVGQAIGNSMFWLVWFLLLKLMGRLGGVDHPPTEPGPLSPGRRAIAVLSLVLFVLLLMPTPIEVLG